MTDPKINDHILSEKKENTEDPVQKSAIKKPEKKDAGKKLPRKNAKDIVRKVPVGPGNFLNNVLSTVWENVLPVAIFECFVDAKLLSLFLLNDLSTPSGKSAIGVPSTCLVINAGLLSSTLSSIELLKNLIIVPVLDSFMKSS